MTVFNKKVVDFTKQPMFLGEPLNVARYDVMKYSKFDSFTEQQLSYFWRPDEVSLTKDIHDFKNKMTDADRSMFIKNLRYQILLDSEQGRAPTQVFGAICSLPELENWLTTWAFSETIHSRSYTHIIKNVFDDPSEVFDSIMTTPEIMERALATSKYYDDMERWNAHWSAGGLPPQAEYQEVIYKALVNVYALEAIRFYVSFICSYSFAERGLMEGNCKIIGLINRDEFLHQGSVHYMLKLITTGKEFPGLGDKIDFQGIAAKMLTEVYEQECLWADYLFEDGPVPGLNRDVIVEYLGWLTNTRYRDLGFTGVVVEGAPHTNPIPWVDSYMKSAATQVAPQEAELSSYMVGAISMGTLDDLEFDLGDDL